MKRKAQATARKREQTVEDVLARCARNRAAVVEFGKGLIELAVDGTREDMDTIVGALKQPSVRAFWKRLFVPLHRKAA
jgi:hypothetical protein